MNSITQLLNVDEHIFLALKEDIPSEDISTNAVVTKPTLATAELLCKSDGIIAGLSVFARTFELLDPEFEVEFFANDGDMVKAEQVLAKLTGDIHTLLSGERTALNYLQRMSGIATYTSKMVALLEGSNIKLLDTRKTTPSMRIFEKYAVKIGGAENHRHSLSDCIMLKDNHIAAAGGVKAAIEMARAYASFVTKIEVEVENLDMLKSALEAGADIIMLDNMSIETMKEAVKITAGRAVLECSGNVTEENIEALISTGVDYISSGALTHSAPILDLSLKNLARI
jgi:nicotinate-nucleotide pyrophosphorylase (carboxylating)